MPNNNNTIIIVRTIMETVKRVVALAAAASTAVEVHRGSSAAAVSWLMATGVPLQQRLEARVVYFIPPGH